MVVVWWGQDWWRYKYCHSINQYCFYLLLSCLPPFSDVANVIQACYGETPPPIVLIGHGVGGAIAVHAVGNMVIPTTVGLVAIDVVEGKKMRLRAAADIHTRCMWHTYKMYVSTHTETYTLFYNRNIFLSSSPVGSAMEALHSIQNFLKGRPKSFKSMDHAIEWRWAFTFRPGRHKKFLQPLSAMTQRLRN